MYLKISISCSKNSKIVANELEFAKHKTISKALKCDYYFCDPYSSWQRALNENINGLMRQYILKRELQKLKTNQITDLENILGRKLPMKFFMNREAA